MHLWETATRPVPSPAEPACNDSTPRYLTARIVAHRQIAAATFRIRLDCPEIATQALPGQFAMLRIPDRLDPLLARPLAVYDSFSAPEEDAVQGPPSQRRYVDFVYVVHGKFTTALKEIPAGENLIVWGPLGNGFVAIPAVEHLVLVAGGIGQTALLALGKEQCGRASYGDIPGHPLLGRPDRRCIWRRGRLQPGRDRRPSGHTRWLSGAAGHRHRPAQYARTRLEFSRIAPCGLLRAGGDDGSGCCLDGRAQNWLPRIARGADGLWHRHLLHLCRPRPGGRQRRLAR